ncbi:MAG: hypothetical protein ACRCZS_02570 [Chroococcidiopsis sp.]
MSTTFKSAINLVDYLSVQAFTSPLCSTKSTLGDRTVWEVNHPKSRAEEIQDELIPDVDLDESQLELFVQYVVYLGFAYLGFALLSFFRLIKRKTLIL